jgi:hypothetical protein
MGDQDWITSKFPTKTCFDSEVLLLGRLVEGTLGAVEWANSSCCLLHAR